MTIIQTIIILSILLYPSTFIHIGAQEEVNVEIQANTLQVNFESIVLPDFNSEMIRLVMLNASQSVALNRFSEITEALLIETNEHTKYLEARGKLNISGNKLKRFIGKILNIKNKISEKQLIEFRKNEMSMVFQRFGLFPHKTVIQNVAYGLEIQGKELNERNKIAMAQIEAVGLRGFEHQYPSQLSGGMQQRVGLGRALATNPGILLMDEAFSALDPLIRSDMQKQLLELQSELKKTIFFITHDLDESLKLGDHIGILNHGRLVQVGTPEDIIMNPADDYVAAFVKDVNRAKVLRARTVMVKPEKFNGKEVKLSESYKVDADTYIEEFLPKVLQDRSTIVVVDNKGDIMGYITEKELAISLSKTSHNEPKKTS